MGAAGRWADAAAPVGVAASRWRDYLLRMPVQVLGWASSLILVLTIGHQVRKQWRERSTEGISKWLFVGQTAASVGFTVYSWLVGDWVFVATNALMTCNGLLGFVILTYNRRRQRSRQPSRSAAAPA